MKRRTTRAARAARALLWGLAGAHVLEAIWLRRRRRDIEVLDTDAAGAAEGGTQIEAVDVLTLEGSAVDGETLAAVAHEMETAGLEVVDLVPGDLPADRALRLLRRVDARQLTENPFHTPGGAHEAVVVKRALMERMGAGTLSGNRRDRSPHREDLARQTVRAQRYAPTKSALRVAPQLRARPYGPRDRWLELAEQTAWSKPITDLAPAMVGMETTHLAAMTAGLLLAPSAALAAVATWGLQPAIAFGRRPGRTSEPASSPGTIRPPGLAAECLLRLPRAWVRNLRTAVAGYRDERAAVSKGASEGTPVVPPVEELFDERQGECPWCGSASLRARLDSPDLRMHKPGHFHLDECAHCGHIFQNPSVSIKGLDYYYEDYYADAGQEASEKLFAGMERIYRDRIEAMARLTEPRAWLDVGTGYGHFCLAARQRWPEASFDGLDMSESVTEAQRRGWIETGHRGQFPDLAASLPSYDVISMHHYLEHTRDPGLELVAAAKVLEPGGHLLIEVPDPESPWARRLGRYWINWCQPQHLHLVTCDNLATAVQDAGFEVVSIERGTATTGLDLTMAALLALHALTPTPHVPWRPAPSVGERVRRIVASAVVLPLIPLTALVDTINDARLGPDDIGSAYRLVARKM